jgi:hypothetical protein
MSDWQRGVDWFLAKYCKCRLRLEWCWCRWRTSAKGRCRWGLQVWRTSRLGLRDPVASKVKCGPHGGKNSKMKSWMVSWLSLKTKIESGVHRAESWVVIGGGYTEFGGFPVVHQKTTRFLGWSTKPKLKNRRRRSSSPRPVWPMGLTGGAHRSDWWGAPVWPVCDDAVQNLRIGGHVSGSQGLRRGEASLQSLGFCPMERRQRFPNSPLRGMWWLAKATLSLRGFQWFTRKSLGSLVDTQSQD